MNRQDAKAPRKSGQQFTAKARKETGIEPIRLEYSGSRKLTIGERARLFLDVTCSELHSILVDLYLASIIAIPGSFYFFESWMFADRKGMRDVRDVTTSLANARKRAMELGWPPIQQLKVRDVYEWLRGVPGFSERRGIDRLGRAIAALSYLVRREAVKEDELSLVWALLGLEALNVGLKSQLLEKSEAFLGVRQQNKKRFGWMYDFRSRLIHGDLDLRYQHNDHDAEPDFEEFWDQIYECEDLATAVLLATLQKLCINRTYSLDFKYAVT